MAEIAADSDVGRWTYWVIQINLDYRRHDQGGRGLVKAWKNGELVYQNLKFTLGDWDPNDDVDHSYPLPASCGNFYPKIGAGSAIMDVKSGANYPLEVYYDEIRWGDENSSFEDVDPSGIGQPDAGPKKLDGGMADMNASFTGDAKVPANDAGVPAGDESGAADDGLSPEKDMSTNSPDRREERIGNTFESSGGCAAIPGHPAAFLAFFTLLLGLLVVRRC